VVEFAEAEAGGGLRRKHPGFQSHRPIICSQKEIVHNSKRKQMNGDVLLCVTSERRKIVV